MMAVGDIFYRLAAKVFQKHAHKFDSMETFQLGVGSKVGVEPIVRAVERAIDGTLD